jgi:hypothetical protein
MLKYLFHLAVPLGCAWLVLSPAAQAAEEKPAAAPPTLAAPFDQYRNWRDEPVLDWRESNARVEAIGGWRSYLRESQQDGSGTEHSRHGH